MKAIASIALVSVLVWLAPATGEAAHEHGHTVSSTTVPAAELYAGEVRRVNADARKITIAHGPLTGFGMPAMTMAFPVKDPALLGKVKQGDKVQFSLERSGEDLVITRIEAKR